MGPQEAFTIKSYEVSETKTQENQEPQPGAAVPHKQPPRTSPLTTNHVAYISPRIAEFGINIVLSQRVNWNPRSQIFCCYLTSNYQILLLPF
jgi:hypothetical protein